jgi:hypothetical protein
MQPPKTIAVFVVDVQVMSALLSFNLYLISLECLAKLSPYYHQQHAIA